ncbi:MAG: hypothetical protein WC822_02270 [Candidatus Paceibacterota bacterium]|jgi:hypothetical protein
MTSEKQEVNVMRVLEISFLVAVAIITTYINAKKVPALESQVQAHETKLAVVDNKLDTIRDDVKDIKNLLRRGR